MVWLDSAAENMRTPLCGCGSGNVQANRPHQFNAVAGGDNAGAEAVIERELVVLKPLLKMNVDHAIRKGLFQRGQGEIVRGDQPDGAMANQGAQNALSTRTAIVGIGALEDLVEENERGPGRG